MKPGPNIVIECPHCGMRECYRTLASGNTFRARLYSDGKFIAPMLPRPPAVACCHACQRCYWLHLAKEEGELPRGLGSDFVTEPTAHQYHAAMDELIAAAPERELALRIATWQRENDPHRTIKDGEHAPAIPPAIGESPPALRSANMRRIALALDMAVPEQRLMCAELYRHLGEFDRCRECLEPLAQGEHSNFAVAVALAAHRGSTQVIRFSTAEETERSLAKARARALEPQDKSLSELVKSRFEIMMGRKRPEPKFKIGQRVRFVGLKVHTESNGKVATIIEGPEWYVPRPEEILKGALVTRRLPEWAYRTELEEPGQWVRERNLEEVESPLTEVDALRAYARMINTLDSTHLEPLLAEDFHYSSQWVFVEIESKAEFIDYIRPKLKTIGDSDAKAFAEMGTVDGYRGRNEPCVVLAQGTREDLVGIMFAKVEDGRLKRLDLCCVPAPNRALRSGEYPE